MIVHIHMCRLSDPAAPVDCKREHGSGAQAESELGLRFDGRCILTFGGSKD